MLRNILAVIAGLVVGSVVNMALIAIGPMVIPPPAGADMTTMEGIQAAMPLFETQHFVFPFLAHALGTLAGALVACLIATRHKVIISFVIGVVFLLGGIAAAYMLPAPFWYEALDLIAAYIPMAWLGGKLGGAGKAA